MYILHLYDIAILTIRIVSKKLYSKTSLKDPIEQTKDNCGEAK